MYTENYIKERKRIDRKKVIGQRCTYKRRMNELRARAREYVVSNFSALPLLLIQSSFAIGCILPLLSNAVKDFKKILYKQASY
jgi:hypothetical protein